MFSCYVFHWHASRETTKTAQTRQSPNMQTVSSQMLLINNITTSQNCTSSLGSKQATNSVWSESWHLKVFLHLSQACFIGQLTNSTSRNFIRFCMLNVNAWKKFLVWGQILISVASCSFAGANRYNWAEVKSGQENLPTLTTAWSQRIEFSLTLQSATPSWQLKNNKKHSETQAELLFTVHQQVH